NVNSATKSYKYKLTLLDSCGREMHLDSSTVHGTINLVLNSLVNDTASITWNKYDGIPSLTYTVKRSINGGVFTAVTSLTINGNDTTYIDLNVPLGTINYRIDADLTSFCNGGGATYSKITSNTITTSNISIKD